MATDRHLIDIYKAIYLLDGVKEPFDFFGPNHPKIGDKVSPNIYFSYNFTYKLDRIPHNCKLTKEDILSNKWVCTKIRQRDYHSYETFRSVDKIDGKRRNITYTDEYGLTCEIVDMPDKAKLIIDYKNGKYTRIELLRIFQQKGYSARIFFNSLMGVEMSGEEYLQVIEELNKEGKI